MPWTIYCHTHTDSGRRYIGLTKNTMLHRWNQHCAQAKSSKGGRWHFPNAIRQYGKEAFSHEVLEVCSSLEEANLAEAKWVDHFNSRDPQFGFNLAPGGDHTPHPKKNPWDDPEFREKMMVTVIPKLIAAGTSSETRLKSLITSRTPEARKKASEATSRQFADLTTRIKMSETIKALHTIPEISKKFNSGFKKYTDERASKTHCKRGHEYTLENTGFNANGSRRCRRCVADRVIEKYHRSVTCCKNGHEYTDGSFKFSKNDERICLICPPQTHCKRGHEFSEKNTKIENERRVCLTCKRLRGRVSDSKRRLKRHLMGSGKVATELVENFNP